MRLRKEIKSHKEDSTPKVQNSEFFISPEKKKKITGILVVIFSLLIILSIFSYSRYDKANLNYTFGDFLRVFSQETEFVTRIESTHNLLGIFGAYISDFLINSTIGWMSLIFPILLFVLGVTIVKKDAIKNSLKFSYFLFYNGLLISLLFGVLRYSLKLFPEVNELSGKVGLFFGTGISRLFGGLGAILFIVTLFVITWIIYFDFSFSAIFGKILEIFGIEKSSEENSEKNKNSHERAELTQEFVLPTNYKHSKGKTFITTLTDVGETTDEEEIVQNTEKETVIKIKKNENRSNIKNSGEESQESEIEEKSRISDKIIIESVDEDIEKKMPEQWEEKLNYKYPTLDLLEDVPEGEVEISEEELKRNAELLKEKLKLFDIIIENIDVTPGPVVTLYELVPAPNVKISKIVNLENDIALALSARGIRIMAPIPGKGVIGVEIPNAKSSPVTAKMILGQMDVKKYELPLALGKTISGEIHVTDLAKMPHLLIAGATGAGKSVGVNMMVTTLLYSKHPSDVKFVIIDPKKIELTFYKLLTKHFLAVSPDIDEDVITTPQNALLVLKSVEIEMDKRYDKLAKLGVKNIVDYNIKVANPSALLKNTESMKHYKLPYIVVVIDELADLMITSGKEVEEPITRIAQLARAVGIHLIVATQRPSVNVITGTIKANFPARIAYQTASKIDSRTILDGKGAEQLLGRGDMLFLPGGMPKAMRIQNAFISTDEVEKVTEFIYKQQGFSKRYLLPSIYDKKRKADSNFLTDMDPMLPEAAKVIIQSQQGSVSYLQRKLKLGYGRASRIIDQLEEMGVVGQLEGSKGREVLVSTEEELESILRSL